MTLRAEVGSRRPWTIAVTCTAAGLVMATVASVYVAVPALARDTGAGETEVAWIVDAYTLVLAVLLLPAGALGDRYGRRGALLTGLAVFVVGSSVPLVSGATGWLIGGRAIAGVGAALLMPATLSLITAGVPADRRRGAIGLWAGIAGVGGFIGVVAAGVLMRYFSWPSVFAFSAVAGVFVFAAAWAVPSSRDSSHPGLDFPGAASSALAVAAIVFGVLEAPTRGWGSAVVVGALGGGVLMLVVFAVVERRAAHPLLDVRLFADREFGSAALCLTLQFFVAFGVLYLLSQYLQFILGYSALATGIAVLPIGVPMLPLAVLTPRLAARWGTRYALGSGLVLLAVALLVLRGTGADSAYWPVMLGLMLFGAGLGLAATPATSAIMDSVPAGKHGVASAVNDTTREVGAAFGIAVASTLLATGYTDHIEGAVETLPAQAQHAAGGSVAAALQVAARLGPDGQGLAQAARDAFLAGMRNGYLILAVVVVAVGTAIVAWAPRRAR